MADEDDLGREPGAQLTPDEPVEAEEQLAARKRRPGRPAKDTTHAAQLDRAKSNFVDALLSVAAGEKQLALGPGGKEIYRFLSISDRADALEQLDKHFAADQKQTAPDASPEHNIEDMRAAVREVIGLPRNAELPVIAAGTIEPQADPSDGGIVESISDPDQIRRFDMERELRTKTAPTQDDSRVALGRGFEAVKDIQSGSNRVVYSCLNPSGEVCATKGSAALARAWFDALYFKD